MIRLLVCLLIALTFFILLTPGCRRRDNFVPGGCPPWNPNDPTSGYTQPMPPTPVTSTKDCAAWINYLSAGIKTIPARGNEALSLIARSDIWGVCSMDQIRNIEANVNAFAFAQTGLGPYDFGVNTMVGNMEANISKYTKDDLCKFAQVVSARPVNVCQDADYIDSYMAKITPATQDTLNKWLTYC